jgi:hypothetical protein
MTAYYGFRSSPRYFIDIVSPNLHNHMCYSHFAEGSSGNRNVNHLAQSSAPGLTEQVITALDSVSSSIKWDEQQYLLQKNAMRTD